MECPSMSSREAFVVTLSVGIVVTTAVHWLCETLVVKYVRNDKRFDFSTKQLNDMALKSARFLYFSVQGLPILAYLLYTLMTSGFAANAALWANAALYCVAFDVYELGQIRGVPSSAPQAGSDTRSSSDFLRIFHHLFELCIILAMSVGGEISPFLIFAGCQVVLGNNAFIFPVLLRLRPLTHRQQVYCTIGSAVIAMLPVIFCAGGIVALLAIGGVNGTLSIMRLVTGFLFVAVFVTLDSILFYKYFLPMIRKARAGKLISPPPKFTSRLRSANSSLILGSDPMTTTRTQAAMVRPDETEVTVGGDTHRSFLSNEDDHDTTDIAQPPANEVTPIPARTPEDLEKEQQQHKHANKRPPLTERNSGALFGLPSNETAEDLTFINGDDSMVISDSDLGDTTLLSTDTCVSVRPIQAGGDSEVAMVELQSARARAVSTTPVVTSEAELMLERGTANNGSDCSRSSQRHSRSPSASLSEASHDSFDDMRTREIFREDDFEDMRTREIFSEDIVKGNFPRVSSAVSVMSTSTTTSPRDMMQLTLKNTTGPRSAFTFTHSRSQSHFSLDLERDALDSQRSHRSRSVSPDIQEEEQLTIRGSHIPRKPLLATADTAAVAPRDDAVVAAPASPLLTADDPDGEVPREYVVSI